VELRGFEPLTSSMPWHWGTLKVLVQRLPHDRRRPPLSVRDRGRWLSVWLPDPKQKSLESNAPTKFLVQGIDQRAPVPSAAQRELPGS
jgi:hypothetical protein